MNMTTAIFHVRFLN